MSCIICGKPKQGHQRCAICEVTNQHARLCSHCRKDPLNDAWCEDWEELGKSADIADSANSMGMTLAELLDVRYRVSDLEGSILRELMQISPIMRQRRCRRTGQRRGTYVVQRAGTTREIARKLGCSKSAVSRVKKKWEKTFRASESPESDA